MASTRAITTFERAVTPDPIAILDALARRIDEAAAAHQVLAVLVVNLPCVHRADALLGHRHGEAIAEEAAATVTRLLRPNDAVHRLDRATLACVLASLGHPAQAWAAAHRVLQTLNHPVQAEGRLIHATPSVGCALFPVHGQDAETLLRHATLAAEAALRTRDRVAVFDAAHHGARSHELELQASLEQALQEQALSLRFQPQLRLADGAVTACEVLTRWEDALLGEIAPLRFIPALETAGWMPRLTHWLLHAALRQLASLPSNLSLAVNLSAQDLSEPDLPALVEQALSTWSVLARRLVLEITETAMMGDDAAVEANLHALKSMGLRLSLDDFGTGHSSLTRLKQLPLAELKIDVSFVRGVLTAERDQHIVRAVIDLGHSLGLTVVAEGVEDAATLDWLARAGCDLAQGFHIAPPVTIAEFARFLQGRDTGTPSASA